MGRQSRGDVGRQALIAGSLTHILETDDLHRASVTHPDCVVVPAVFALAARESSNGREMLLAILQGFEAMCRIGMAVGPAHYRIWHNTATCGPFGSAMAAASLLKLSDLQAMLERNLQDSGSFLKLEPCANIYKPDGLPKQALLLLNWRCWILLAHLRCLKQQRVF